MPRQAMPGVSYWHFNDASRLDPAVEDLDFRPHPVESPLTVLVPSNEPSIDY